MKATAKKADVRHISSRRASPGTGECRIVTAQLSVTASALARLLSVSGSQSDFILSSADGGTTVRVGLAVSSVPDAQLVLGTRGVVLDWSRSTITLGPNRATLTRMELRLLAAFLEQAPEPATREHLIARLWPSDLAMATERNVALNVWICALRRRLAGIGVPEAIQTVWSKGYCLNL